MADDSIKAHIENVAEKNTTSLLNYLAGIHNNVDMFLPRNPI